MEHKTGGTIKATYEIEGDRIWVTVTSGLTQSMKNAIADGSYNNWSEEYSGISYEGEIEFSRYIDKKTYKVTSCTLEYDAESGRFYADVSGCVLAAYGNESLRMEINFEERNYDTNVAKDYSCKEDVRLGYFGYDISDIPVIADVDMDVSTKTFTVTTSESGAAADYYMVDAHYYESNGGDAGSYGWGYSFDNVITVEPYEYGTYEEKIKRSDYILYNVTAYSDSVASKTAIITVKRSNNAVSEPIGLGTTVPEADTTAPTAGKLTAVQQGNEIRLTASKFKDNVGIEIYEFYLDGEEIGTSTSNQYTYELSEGQAGTLNFSVCAFDFARNQSKPAKVTVKITDKTPPEVVTGLSVQDGANEKTAVLEWEKSSDNSGKIASYTIYVDGRKAATSKTNRVTVKKLKAGSHTFTVTATDGSKNTSDESEECDFWVADGTAPKAGKLLLKQESANEIKLTFDKFSDNVGIDHYEIYLNNEWLDTAYDAEYFYYQENLGGKLTFSVEAVDTSENVSKRVSTTITIKDVTPPEQVTGLSVQEGANEKTAILEWEKSSDNSGKIASYTIYVDGKKAATSKTNNVTLKKLKAGSHTFTVTATDGSKNTSEKSEECDFWVADGTAPKAGKLLLNQESANEIKLTFDKFSDNVEIDRYEIYLNNEWVGTAYDAEYFYYQENLGGKLTFSVEAVDTSENVSKRVSSTITIKDVTPPEVVTGLSGTKGSDGKSVTLSWEEPYDNSGSIASYEIWVDGKKKATAKTNSAVIKGLSAEAHDFQVLAVDGAKNKGELSDSISVNLGKAAVLTGVDAQGKTSEEMHQHLENGDCDCEDWDAAEAGVNDLEVASHHWVQIDNITFTDGGASLVINKGDLHAVTTLYVQSSFGFGSGDDLLEIQDHAELRGTAYYTETVGIDFGDGNDTLRLCGSEEKKYGGLCLANGMIDLGSGNDLVELQKNAALLNSIDLGSGNDVLQIDAGATHSSEINFGSGCDTLILNGKLTLDSADLLQNLEKVQGKGDLVLTGFEVEAGSFDNFVKAGVTVINAGSSFNFTSAAEELADNTKAGAVDLNSLVRTDTYEETTYTYCDHNIWLCSKESAAEMAYGFADAVDWLKFTVGGQNGFDTEGTLEFSNYGNNIVCYELQDAKGRTRDTFSGTSSLELSELVAGTYYLRVTVCDTAADSASGWISYSSNTNW